jgi:hypothetical protein
MLLLMLHWLTKALHRHSSKVTSASNRPPPPADQLVGHILALEAVGWRIAELRPSLAGNEPPLWRVSITRFDLGASMSASAVDPENALVELLHCASADAEEEH